jgi:hypothetical protein
MGCAMITAIWLEIAPLGIQGSGDSSQVQTLAPLIFEQEPWLIIFTLYQLSRCFKHPILLHQIHG